MYQVLARKWRPQVFEDLVGQQTVTQTLQNAIRSNRLAHAFLFSGPRGVGKTTCARILAKALNCQSFEAPTPTPCNECASCVDIANSRSLDVLEIDGASNRGIDEVRELRESAKYQAMRDRFRIFIIDEVHMLTLEAFNALLKILEEPPAHVYFIFATTDPRKVPGTILSRCQLHDFKRIADSALTSRLLQITKAENISISEKALRMIASASEGGLRDALSTLDQVIAFGGAQVEEKDVENVLGLVDSEVMIELGEAIAAGEASAVLQILNRIAEYGVDYKIFYNELLSFYRNLFLIRFTGGEGDVDPRLRKLAGEYEELHLLRIGHQLVSIQNLIRLSGNLRFLFEITLVKLSQIKRMIPLDELAQSIKKNAELPVQLKPVSGNTARNFIASRSEKEPVISRTAPEPRSVPTLPVAQQPVKDSMETSEPSGDVNSGTTFPENLTDDFFPLLITDLEKQNSRLAAALENARFQRFSNKIIFYVPEIAYRRMKLESKDVRDLQALISARFAGAIEVDIKAGEPPAEKEAIQISTPETLVQNDPVVQEFVKAFKGKISKIELNKERYQ